MGDHLARPVFVLPSHLHVLSSSPCLVTYRTQHFAALFARAHTVPPEDTPIGEFSSGSDAIALRRYRRAPIRFWRNCAFKACRWSLNPFIFLIFMSFIALGAGLGPAFSIRKLTLRSIRCFALLASLFVLFGLTPAAYAVDAISVRSDTPAIDLTGVLEFQRSDTDRIQVLPRRGLMGIVRRIELRSREGGQNWIVFALANNTDDQLDRLIVVPHYRVVSSGRQARSRFSRALPISRLQRVTGPNGRTAPPLIFSYHARSRRGGDLCGRAAHRQNSPALCTGSRKPTRTKSIHLRCIRAS
ncbi:MAG: hypothetical protein QM805_13055 [Pseudomonas sp.]